jgi:threonine/homoserine/homoserine lactone efflux protein
MPGTMLYISVETFGAFALTCLVIELTPGPNMTYLAVLSAGNGRRAGFPPMSGHTQSRQVSKVPKGDV